MTIHRLPGVPEQPGQAAQPHESSIEILRELLADAQAGQVRGVVAAWIGPDGMPMWQWSDMPGPAGTGIIGAMTIAAQQIAREITQADEQ